MKKKNVWSADRLRSLTKPPSSSDLRLFENQVVHHKNYFKDFNEKLPRAQNTINNTYSNNKVRKQ